MNTVPHNRIRLGTIFGVVVGVMFCFVSFASVFAQNTNLPTSNFWGGTGDGIQDNFNNSASRNDGTTFDNFNSSVNNTNNPIGYTPDSLANSATPDNPATKDKNANQPITDPNIDGTWIQKIGSIILKIGAIFVYVGGLMLQFALKFLVFQLGSLLATDGTGIGTAIVDIWKFLRDISNLVFIFGFMYVGFKTIIDPGGVETKRFLSRIIIGALLINFSLYFVKVVIDFSNFLTNKMYIFITTTDGVVSATGDISAKIIDTIKLGGLYDVSTGNLVKVALPPDSFWFYVMGFFLMLVVAFVLAAGGMLLIVRFVGLIYVMIFSPFLFSATVFPQTEEYAQSLQKKLFSNAFFAPVYLFLILISIKLLVVINKAIITGPNTTLAEALHNGKTGINSFEIILFYGIAIVFFLTALSYSQKMVGKGADLAVKAGGAATLGLAAGMGRLTAGAAGNRLANNAWLLEKASSGKGVGGFAARLTHRTASGIAQSSFDVRNAAPKVGVTGLGEGGGKGGYVAMKQGITDTYKAYELQQAERLGYDHHKVEKLELQYEKDKKAAKTRQQKAEQRVATGEISALQDEFKAERTAFIAANGGRNALVRLNELNQRVENGERLVGQDLMDHTALNGASTRMRELSTELEEHRKDIKAMKDTEDAFEKAVKEEKGRRAKAYAEVVEESSLPTFFGTDGHAVAHLINHNVGKLGETANKLRPASGGKSGSSHSGGGGGSHGGGHGH